jgi:hypothetical protein
VAASARGAQLLNAVASLLLLLTLTACGGGGKARATRWCKVYQAISHSLIGEAVFEKVLRTFDPADDSRYTLLRSRIPSAEAIEAAIDLDDPEIVQRLAAVYERAEELLQERLARRSRSRRRSAGDDGSET